MAGVDGLDLITGVGQWRSLCASSRDRGKAYYEDCKVIAFTDIEGVLSPRWTSRSGFCVLVHLWACW